MKLNLLASAIFFFFLIKIVLNDVGLILLNDANKSVSVYTKVKNICDSWWVHSKLSFVVAEEPQAGENFAIYI